MKIAISTDQGFVSPHFGRCPTFTFAQIENDQVLKTEEIDNPGHHPGFLPQFLSERGVECIICGGMGHRAQSLFRERGIQTIVGVAGRVEDVIDQFAHGDLEGGKSMCDRVPGSGHDRGECHHGEGQNQE
jgi:predicted Fe-Mo cluster-binding NifX family protein